MDGTEREPSLRRRRSRRRTLLRVALVVVLVVGLYGFLPRLVGLAEQAEVLRQADPGVLAVAVLAEAGAVVLYAVAYRRVLLEMGARVRLSAVFDAMMSGFLVGHVAVGGTAAGAVVTVEALRDSDVDVETSSEAMGFLALFTASGVLALLTLGLGIASRGEPPAAYRVGVGVAGGLVLVGIGLTALLAHRPASAERLGRWLGRRRLLRRSVLGSPEAGAALRRLSDRAHALVALERVPGTALPVLGQLTLDVTSLYLFLVAAGAEPAAAQVLVAYGLGTIVGVLPLTPSGLGVVEATLIGVLVAAGSPAAAVVPAVLGYRLVNFWLPLPVGAVSYLRVHLARRRRSRAASQA